MSDEDRLAQILWRAAKQLVALLEKEYGFGQKQAPYFGNDAGKDVMTGEYRPLPLGHRAGEASL